MSAAGQVSGETDVPDDQPDGHAARSGWHHGSFVPAAAAGDAEGHPAGAGTTVVVVVTALLVLLVVGQSPFAVGLGARLLATWTSVFVSVMVQAVPFLVAGVVLSAAIATWVPPSFWARALPKRSVLAVPVAGAAGVLLPGCECGAVPMGAALVRRGVTPAVAVTFLLAAPAVNPVVLTATRGRVPGKP